MVQAVNASVEFLVRRSTKHTLERALFRQPACLQLTAYKCSRASVFEPNFLLIISNFQQLTARLVAVLYHHHIGCPGSCALAVGQRRVKKCRTFSSTAAAIILV
jgi:hypothetical protein